MPEIKENHEQYKIVLTQYVQAKYDANGDVSKLSKNHKDMLEMEFLTKTDEEDGITR